MYKKYKFHSIEIIGIIVKVAAIIVVLVVIIGGMYFWYITGKLGMRPYDNPPKIGEPIEEVIARLGPPQFDSRNINQYNNLNPSKMKEEYKIGYTDGIGTRHHITVKDGKIIDIKYSTK